MCSNIILRPSLRFIQLITLLLMLLLLLSADNATLQPWYFCLYWDRHCCSGADSCMNNVPWGAAWEAILLLTIQICFTLVPWGWCSQSTIILWNADDTTNWANSYFIWRLKCVSTLIRNWQNTFKCQFGNEFLGSKYPSMSVCPDVVWCNPSHCGTEGWYC